MELVKTKRVKQIADLAVYSFVKMIADMTVAYSLLKYKNNKGLKDRIKNFEGVKMGFGMHVGWAIEGPIGSEYKIDASYLSPIVNIAGQLEAGTKGYGVPMLVTGNVYDLMTENKRHMRHIDRVKIAGEKTPIDLYTVDVSPKTLLKAEGIRKPNEANGEEKKKAKIKNNFARRQMIEEIEVKYITNSIWDFNDFHIMREPFTSAFFEQFSAAFKEYLKGNWEKAQTGF